MILDALLHLEEASEKAGDLALSHGGSDMAGCWWGGSLGSTEEEGLQALTQSLQGMWSEEAGDLAPNHDIRWDRRMLVDWWGAHGSTQEEGLQALAQSLQNMWDMGKCPTVPGPATEDTLPARARTSPGLPSRMDVPTRDHAEVRVSAASVLGAIRQLAALVWPAEHPASVAAADSGSCRGQAAGYADWEVLQAEVLMPQPSSERPQLSAASPSAATAAATTSSSSGGVQVLPTPSSSSAASCCWGEGLWCFNHACTDLSGPSELAMQTSACGGGCGVRYCSPECQAQGWRDGHRLSCARLRARREGLAST